MHKWMIFSVAALAACEMGSVEPDGARLFAENCAGCHGKDAGGGPAVDDAVPPDLTRIAQRNGGVLPVAEVLSTIDGFHAMELSPRVMPEWGLIFGDPTALVDVGDGIMTPISPELLALLEHLQRVQVTP